jgi:DNA polymerase-3 subunit delta
VSLDADSKLDRLLASGRLDGAFFLFGDARRLRDEGLRRLTAASADEATREFNLDLFRGGDADPEALSSALAMPPMMAARRVVVLTEAQELTPKSRKLVEESLENLPDQLAFIVVASIPSRSKAVFYKRLKERCTWFEWKAPRDAELPGWLLERARDRHGFELTHEAAQALAAAIGNDTSLLDAELEKLASAVAGGRAGIDVVRGLVPNLRAVNRWGWLDQVAARRYQTALRDLPRLLSEPSESAVGLLIPMIEQHIYIGLALEGGHRLVTEAMTRAGRGQLKWKARTYTDQAREWRAPQLDRALRLMRRADWQAKTGGRDVEVLEGLLLSLSLLRRQAA